MNPTLENKTIEMAQHGNVLRKRMPSKLGPFTEPLLQMERENKTIDQMVDWLKERDVITVPSNLSHFLKRRRAEAERKELQEQLERRANKCQVFQEWFAKNPTPDLGTVMEIFKQLMMELGASKTVDPELVKLADKLAGTVIRFQNTQSREMYRTRKLVMEEAKHAEWVKVEQTRALEFCLIESKKYPAVADLFRGAFNALEEAKTENRRRIGDRRSTDQITGAE